MTRARKPIAAPSLGPSNDDSPAVELEMFAAERIADIAADGGGESDVWCDDETTEIAGGPWQDAFNAALWTWDISRPIAEQLAETAADDAAADTMEADGSIRALRESTMAAGGNAELVEVCDIALGDKPPPFGPGLETVDLCRAECLRAVAGGGREPAEMASGLRTQAEVDAFSESMVDRAIAEDGSDGAP